MTSYSVNVTDKSGNIVMRIPIATPDGYAYPLTPAGADELSAEIGRAISEHEIKLEAIAKNEVPM